MLLPPWVQIPRGNFFHIPPLLFLKILPATHLLNADVLRRRLSRKPYMGTTRRAEYEANKQPSKNVVSFLNQGTRFQGLIPSTFQKGRVERPTPRFRSVIWARNDAKLEWVLLEQVLNFQRVRSLRPEQEGLSKTLVGG